MVDIWSRIVQTLYPPICALCGAPGHDGLDLCVGCLGDLRPAPHACPRCAAPLPARLAVPCGACLRRPPAFDAARARLIYRPPAARLVTDLKFNARLAHARILGRLMAEIMAGMPRPDVVLPVPLHEGRLRERGFNQALEIARPAARLFDIPLEPRLAARIRATAPQTDLDARARRRNLRGAFSITGAVAGLHIALVDDVMTTGTTLDELARALKRAGAETVTVYAAARSAGRGGW